MSKIKHVSFDFWGTIANPNPEFYAARAKYLANLSGKSEEFILETIQRLKLEYEALGKKHLVGVPARTQTFVLLESLGISNLLEDFEEIWGELTSLFYEYPPIMILDLNTFFKLVDKKEFTFSITCNTGFIDGVMVETWLAEETPLQNYFKFYVFSDEDGNLFKPNPLIYFKIQDEIWIDAPDEILHVGDDDTTDGELCHRTGMKYFKVTGNNYADILNYV